MRKKRNRLTWIILMSVLFTGCAEEQDIPELIEPSVNNESFRPVEYGGAAKTEIKMADVVPEEYCHFMKKGAQISEITVDLGQYVEAGELLAVMDVTEMQGELSAKEKELALQRTLFSYQDKIGQEQVKEQKLKKQDYKKNGDKKAAADCDTQVSILEENERYDTLLYKHRVTMLEEEIADLKEMIEEGTIKATHSGYVTYVKNLAESDQADAYENVVIVSDYDSLHLELTEDMSSEFYEANKNAIYDETYALLNGTRCNVKLYTYSNQELVAIQSAGIYPRIRLEVDSLEKNATPGDKIPVYFESSKKKNVLRVGMDSLYSTGNSYFVYVKNGDSKEKREIQIGYRNDLYAEVTEGLKEGEWVFYSSNAIMPEQYEEYTVEKQEYTPAGGNQLSKANVAYTQIYSYTESQDAVVSDIYFAKGDTVQKGDLICTLQTKTSSAKLKEMQHNMSNMVESHKETVKGYDKQMKELDQQIKAAKKQYAKQNKERVTERSENLEKSLDKEKRQQVTATEQLGVVAGQTDKETEQSVMTAGQTDEETVQSVMTEGQGDEKEEQSATVTEQKKEETEQSDTETTEQTETQSPVEDTESNAEKSTESSDEESISATYAQQLECQKNILSYEKKSMQAQYDYDYSMMQREYDEMLKTNNGTGKMDIYAKQNGILGNLNIYEDKKIKAEEDANLFQIYEESSKKLALNTKDNYLGAGNEVTVSFGDDKQVYQGTVIGNSAMPGKVYVTQRDEKIYITTSDSWADGNQAYIMVAEEIPSDINTADIVYSSARLRDVVILPIALVNEEVNNLKPDITYHYVWKIVDGNFVKQYVQVADKTLNTDNEICVLEGLESGDILANPILNQ